MVHEALRTLLEALEVARPAFTRSGFDNLVVVFAGWALTSGPHAVTQALVTTGVAGRRHHEAFHRFFSRGTWDPDEVGRLLFGWIARHLREGAPVRSRSTTRSRRRRGRTSSASAAISTRSAPPPTEDLRAWPLLGGPGRAPAGAVLVARLRAPRAVPGFTAP